MESWSASVGNEAKELGSPAEYYQRLGLRKKSRKKKEIKKLKIKGVVKLVFLSPNCEN